MNLQRGIRENDTTTTTLYSHFIKMELDKRRQLTHKIFLEDNRSKKMKQKSVAPHRKGNFLTGNGHKCKQRVTLTVTDPPGEIGNKSGY